MNKMGILIAEDSKLLREGLCLMINSDEDLEVVAQASDGLEAVKCALHHSPDLAMIDLSMPKMDGVSAIREIRRENPDIKLLALTIHDSDEFILECFNAGVQGYCLKDSSREELLQAVHTVLAGKTYINPNIADKVMEGYIEGKKSLRKETAWDTVTQREKEVLKLVGEGYSSKEIADFLCISSKTVERHRSNLMKKLGLHNASELTALAIDKGLVTS